MQMVMARGIIFLDSLIFLIKKMVKNKPKNAIDKKKTISRKSITPLESGSKWLLKSK